MAEPAHLIHVFATFCAAGPQVRAAALMDAFGDRFRHTVYAVDGRTEARDLVRSAQVECAAWAPDGSAMAGIRFARDLLKAERPDLLLTYNFGSMDAVLAARTARFDRHVHHEDGFNVDEAKRLKGRRNWARRISLRSTDVILPSEKLRTIARKTWRLPRVHLIPNGIDAARFARNPDAGRAFRAEHGIDTDEVVIGAVGHLRPVKNLGRLIRAAASAPMPDGVRARVVLVGDGAEREALERVVAECSDRIPVTFTGHLGNLAPAYSAFDVLGISSDSEQQPISLLEAMAAGLPVAATDVGDVASTLPPEARAHVVPNGPGAERDLGVALAALVADPERRAALGALSEERVKASFSLEGMVEAYRRVYDLGLGR
ncbi:MAG: glycosyltransferase [Planctomycetota bacterium]